MRNHRTTSTEMRWWTIMQNNLLSASEPSVMSLSFNTSGTTLRDSHQTPFTRQVLLHRLRDEQMSKSGLAKSRFEPIQVDE